MDRKKTKRHLRFIEIDDNSVAIYESWQTLSLFPLQWLKKQPPRLNNREIRPQMDNSKKYQI